ncbi:hypothetical protein [Elstera sp.]|jgi:hypothetical protein|uniref:hypothetical protein n=1 Tax=Elstera sp. TaxID=1916664 RepID=UPI0037BF5AA8
MTDIMRLRLPYLVSILSVIALSGCDFTQAYRLRHPNTGEVRSCSQWRGDYPKSAQDDVWTCIKEYQDKGFALIDPPPESKP